PSAEPVFHLQFQPGGIMANLKGLGSIVAQLREERTNLVNQLRHVDAALSVLGKLDGGRSYTKSRRRRLSAAARKRIGAAQRARWARVRGKQQKAAGSGQTSTAAPHKRILSAATRRKIAAAQKARWAKVRGEQK
ncbi:MAG: hypothetical protein DMG72_22605, partial [Acidobacteria bacterium]